MRHFRSKSGAFQREVKTFADLVTFDLVEAAGDAENNDKYVMTIRDIYTGIIMGYRKNTVTVINSIKHFAGRRKIKQVYSDDAPEFINACSELKIPHDLSLPGKKQNNSLTHEPVHRGPNNRMSSTCWTSKPPDECRRDQRFERMVSIAW